MSVTEILVFGADWCLPCRKLEQKLPILRREFGEQISITKIDIDQRSDVAEQYGIRGIPTLVVLRGDAIIFTLVGDRTESELQQIF